MQPVPLWATATVASLFGALVGSFLNVVVYRVPQGMSITAPGSFCPSCRRALAWWENVPVFGWIALRGRCHTCKAPISPRYPLVEAGNAAMWGAIALAAGGRQATIPLCILSSTVLGIWLIELDGSRAPRAVSAAGTSLALVATAIAYLVKGHGPLIGVLIGTAGGTAAYALLAAVDRTATAWAAHGRSALVPAGPFLGALPATAALAGSATIIFAAAAAALIGSVASRAAGGAGLPEGGGASPGRAQPGRAQEGPGGEAETGCSGGCGSCGPGGACAPDARQRPAGRFPDLGILAVTVALGTCVALAVAAFAPASTWP